MEEIFEKITDAELEVMKVLWNAKEALPVSEIRQALQGSLGWEATTIKTLVQRLCGKKALIQEKRKNFYYRPAVSQEDYNDWATNRLIRKLYRGRASSLVATLVKNDGLSPDDIAELKALFDQF